MTTVEIVVQAVIKLFVLWGSLALVGLPVAKILIEVAYEIWREGV